MQEWTYEWVMHKLGKPLDWWPDGGMYSAEAEQVLQQAINLLKADTVSGYQEVYKVGGKWQAKPYVSPGVQRTWACLTTHSSQLRRSCGSRSASCSFHPLPNQGTSEEPAGSRGAE